MILKLSDVFQKDFTVEFILLFLPCERNETLFNKSTTSMFPCRINADVLHFLCSEV